MLRRVRSAAMQAGRDPDERLGRVWTCAIPRECGRDKDGKKRRRWDRIRIILKAIGKDLEIFSSTFRSLGSGLKHTALPQGFCPITWKPYAPASWCREPLESQSAVMLIMIHKYCWQWNIVILRTYDEILYKHAYIFYIRIFCMWWNTVIYMYMRYIVMCHDIREIFFVSWYLYNVWWYLVNIIMLYCYIMM